MAGQSNITPRLNAREYTVTNYMFDRVKDIYKYYLLSIGLKSKNYEELFNRLDIKKVVNYIIDTYFNYNYIKSSYISIIDGHYTHLPLTKSQYIKNNRLLKVSDIDLKTLSLQDLTYFFKTYTDASLINGIHPSRTIYIDYQGRNRQHCAYLKNACELYERAVNSAGFILEHNNHTIVKLGSGDDNSGDHNYKSSILNLTSSGDDANRIKDLDKVLEDTLIVDQFKVSILGTQDDVVRLNSSFSAESYKTIKENLLSKVGVPYSILFGSSGAEDDAPTYIMFFDNINNFFKSNIEPFLRKLLDRIGIGSTYYTFDYLYFEDTSYKNKRLEVLSKALDVLNKVSEGEEEQDLNKIKKKIIKSLDILL